MTETPESSAHFSYEVPCPLVQRLLRRYTAPMGVIKVTHSQAHFNRLTAWFSGRFPLLAQLSSRRLSEEKFPAVPGTFVFRTQGFTQNFSNTFVNVATAKEAVRAIKPDYSVGTPVSRHNPFLPTDKTALSNGSKSRGTLLSADNSGHVINVGNMDTSTDDKHKIDDQHLHESTDQKRTQHSNDNHSPVLPPSDNPETGWRLRRVSGNYPDKNITSSNPDSGYRLTTLESPIEQLAKKEPVPERFSLDRQNKDRNLHSAMINNKSDAALTKNNNMQILQQGFVKNRSELEKKPAEQVNTFPIFSEPDTDKEMIPGSKRVYRLREQLVKQAKTINQSKITGSVTASRYVYQLPNSTANQTQTTADNPLIWRNLKINNLDSLRQNSRQTNSVTAQGLSNLPGLDFLSQPSVDSLTAKGQKVKNLDTPIKENLVPEFETNRNRLSKREWTQLIDRVSRIILNKLVIDLDRRGIRVWR